MSKDLPVANLLKQTAASLKNACFIYRRSFWPESSPVSSELRIARCEPTCPMVGHDRRMVISP